MRVVLATFGTDGDVFPYVALGKELAVRGHDVVLAASSEYEAIARENGASFHPLVSSEESEVVLGNPEFWHPLKGGVLAARWGTTYLPRQHQLLASLTQSAGSLLIANPGVLAARLVHDTHKVPIITLGLQPWIFPSIHSPPLIPGRVALPKNAPRPLWRLWFAGMHAAGDWLLARSINSVRSQWNLAPVKKIFHWWHSPQRILALFPEWFGPMQPDWPAQLRHVSFPLIPAADEPLSTPVLSFLSQGPPPVLVTMGTGVRHVGWVYQAAMDACQSLGLRCLAITKHLQQLPRPLPPHVFAASHAPFGTVFPRCSAVIHHGGIGTTARALHASLPQLIVPIAYDQLDNATRVQSLRAGSFLPLSKVSASSLANKLRAVLSSKSTLSKDQLDSMHRTLQTTAAWIEEFAQGPHQLQPQNQTALRRPS